MQDSCTAAVEMNGDEALPPEVQLVLAWICNDEEAGRKLLPWISSTDLNSAQHAVKTLEASSSPELLQAVAVCNPDSIRKSLLSCVRICTEHLTSDGSSTTKALPGSGTVSPAPDVHAQRALQAPYKSQSVSATCLMTVYCRYGSIMVVKMQHASKDASALPTSCPCKAMHVYRSGSSIGISDLDAMHGVTCLSLGVLANVFSTCL